MSITVIAILFIALLFMLLLMGVKIAFSMALVGFLGFACVTSFEAALNLIAIDIYNTFANYGFTVVPLFMLMGQIGANAGVARRLYDSSYKFVGHIPGGLALSTILGAVLFKAVCGSTPATVATFATVAVPEMDRYNYDKKLSCGTVATVGTLGNLLPPAVSLIIYGIIAVQSIAKLFLAGILPGLLIALGFFVTIIIWCKINPMVGPKGERCTWHQRFGTLPSILPVVIIFILVIGGLMKGFFTPTEAGSVGTFAILLLSLIKRDMGLKGFIKSVLDSLGTACMVLSLIAGATILGHFFAVTNIPTIVAGWLGGLHLPRELIIVIIMFVYLIGGSFIEDMAFMILVTPIFLPVVSKMGYDPIWFGIMVMVIIMIGVVLPPIAVCVFIVSTITKVPQGIVYRGVYPFLGSIAICAIIILLFPQFSLWLPNMIMK